MFCTKCGNQIKDGFKFCPKCGTPIYVEKESSQNVDKTEDVDEVAKEAKVSLDNSIESVVEEKKDKKTETSSKSKKKNNKMDSPKNSSSIPLIEKELDIAGLKKKAEQGDKNSILRQAFRYEMGIGVEKNQEKADNLYSQAGGKSIIPQFEDIRRPTIIPSDHYYNTI